MSCSDSEKSTGSETISCTSPHEGRVIVDKNIAINIDELFILIFTDSAFILDLYASRKNTDIIQTPWTYNSENDTQSRVINLTVPISNPFGPKTSHVTETQTMLPCTKPGFLYSIDVEITNAGIPYADCFSICYHYCLKKNTENETSFIVFAYIKFKKSVWGLTKGIIEKNCWSGLDSFFSDLMKALDSECKENVPKRKKRKHQKHKEIRSNSESKVSDLYVVSKRVKYAIGFLFIILVLVNIGLYLRLQSLKEDLKYEIFDFHQLVQNPPESHEDWLSLLETQEKIQNDQVHKWHQYIKNGIKLLKQTEETLKELQGTFYSKPIQISSSDKEKVISREL